MKPCETALVLIRRATLHDLPAILDIYNHYVEHDVVTFDVDPVTVDERRDWLASFDDEHPCFVCDIDGRVAGYAYYAPLRPRAGYEHSKETTVYVSHTRHGHGIGSALYSALIEHARARGVHTLVGVLGGDNPASAALHEKFGFEPVGQLKEVGFKLGRYVDTYYYQKVL